MKQFKNISKNLAKNLVVTHFHPKYRWSHLWPLFDRNVLISASAVSGSQGGVQASAAGTGPVIAIVIVAIIIIVVIVVAVIARSQGMLCFADKSAEEDGKKSTAQFEALEKGDELPEKEPIKESNDIKDAAEPSVNATETVNEKCENDEKKSNGNHTPV